MSAKLAEWPDAPLIYSPDSEWLQYESAIAAAYRGRLEVAMDALRHYESIMIMFYEADIVTGRSVAYDALKAIGPLPPAAAAAAAIKGAG